MMTSSTSEVRIPLSEPNLGGNVSAYLAECIESNYVSSVGPFVDRFEREFADSVGSRYAVACASGTAAIHVAMRLADVEPGDEVLVADLTFVASANPILYQQAVPILVDAEGVSWNLDPQLIVDELDRRARRGLRQPKAVEVVHILGQPAEIGPVVDACRRYGVFLIEDAAEALGASYRGGPYDRRQVGTIGDVGCFSFNGNKIITTGGGGMLTTDDLALAQRAKHLTTQARLPGLVYRHDEVGYNYRLTNIAAALGLGQLELLPQFLERKREIARRYEAALADLPGITPAPHPDWAKPSFWLYSIGVDPSALGIGPITLAERLSSAGVDARPIWPPLHTLPMYHGAVVLGDRVAEHLFDRGLSLPSSTNLTVADQDRVIASLIEGVGAN